MLKKKQQMNERGKRISFNLFNFVTASIRIQSFLRSRHELVVEGEYVAPLDRICKLKARHIVHQQEICS